MKSTTLIFLFFLLTLTSTAQVNQVKENTAFIDTISSSIGNIKEELIKIKENYYIIKPYGLAANTGVYVN